MRHTVLMRGLSSKRYDGAENVFKATLACILVTTKREEPECPLGH